MSGIIWHFFTFSALGIFLALMVYRIIAIMSMPVHLRWELAPIPHEKGKGKYGGSYLEEYEWWRKRRRRSYVAPVIYMAGEIFLLKGVWKNNRTLWPFSFALHTGIYLVIITIVLYLVNALFIITGVSSSILNVFQSIAAVISAAGYLLGSLGAIGLILKRTLDAGLRAFSTFSTYFRLVFLGGVFITGAFARFYAVDFASEMSLFVKRLITLDAGITVTAPLAAHLIIFLLFIIYLPLTDMAHFITKYFTYHAVRWNDAPQDEKMKAKLRVMMMQPVSWSAAHVKAGRKSWAETAAGESGEKEKP
jgi:nitrate reductase gamma subunit